jgi:hypothetical protein
MGTYCVNFHVGELASLSTMLVGSAGDGVGGSRRQLRADS